MEKVKLQVHKHPLLPVTRFSRSDCKRCGSGPYIYGGYRCNELGCQSVFHRDCAESLPIFNHPSHSFHPLMRLESDELSICSSCSNLLQDGYECSICAFKICEFCCAERPAYILEKSNLHEHPLKLIYAMSGGFDCITCNYPISSCERYYNCSRCNLPFHVECAKFFPEANHTSHPQHPLKLLRVAAAPDYADEKCLLCGIEFFDGKLHHCDACNFSICKACMKTPPPVCVDSPTTHEHQLHLVPRRIDFTCNTCGTLGDRSPYFCLQCNIMIHRECIDLPRVININRHYHRISYTCRLGHGEEWKCKVCREKVDGFYGAYTCGKCPSFVVHSRCATRKDVWDMVELEGIPEEEVIAPFEVIDANTIKHFSHDHNLLRINKDGDGQIQPENIVCEACVLQILSEPFYSCEQCKFILHEKCANHPRKKRHVHSNQPFTLLTDSRDKIDRCGICEDKFTGFRYRDGLSKIIDVRCAAISDTFEHGSHQDPLYYYAAQSRINGKRCNACVQWATSFYRCDACDYTLDCTCAHFPKKIMRNRYDDHPLFLSFGDMNVNSDYWCETCETKVNPKEWFYTCNDCGTALHISCVLGDFSYIMPGSHIISTPGRDYNSTSGSNINREVVSNTSICRPFCYRCKSRCDLPSIIKISEAGGDAYACSFRCSSYIE